VDYSSIFNHIDTSNVHRYDTQSAKEFEESYSNSSYNSQANPLSREQMGKIKGLIDYFLLTQERCERTSYGITTKEFKGKFGNVTEQECLYKTYGVSNKEIEKAKNLLGDEKKYSFLLDIIQNPALIAKELGLDSTNKAQIYAARVFMKSICKINPWNNRSHSFEEVLTKYNKKMFDQTTKNIKPKHQLLIDNDPVKNTKNGSKAPLDILLEHTYFLVPGQEVTTTRNGQETIETFGPEKEEYRQMISTKMHELYKQSPYLKDILDAIAMIIATEKGNIFFGHVITSAYPFTTNYRLTSTVGFYNEHHSIFSSTMCNPYNKKFSSTSISTLIHEGMHFINTFLFHNLGDPCFPDDHETAKALDEVLKLDREHREKNQSLLSDKRFEDVKYTFVGMLEKDKGYFPGGFDPTNPVHLTTMRAEAIVRCMEQLAEGESIETIEAVAPNLWVFYRDKIHPQIQQFVKQAIEKRKLDREDEKPKEIVITELSKQPEEPPKLTEKKIVILTPSKVPETENYLTWLIGKVHNFFLTIFSFCCFCPPKLA